MKITDITNKYSGYTNRLEVTNTPDPTFIVEGSKNVIVDWLNSLSSRRGYVTLGQTGGTGGVQGEGRWRTNRGQYYNLRKISQSIQVKHTHDDVTTWVTIPFVDGTSFLPNATQFATFASIFNDTKKIDEVLIAAGNARFYSWSGATGKVTATTSDTITIDANVGSRGFAVPSGTVYVNGTAYTYTGVTGSQFTGVSPNPTSEAVGSLVAEGIRSHAIASIPANFTCDHVGVFRNQAYLGSITSRIVLVSNAVDFTNFTTSTAVGGARTLTIDDNSSGFLASKNSMLMFGQNESLFEVKYTISADQTKEYFEIERLATAPEQGVISPLAKIRIKNAIMYVTREKTLDTIEFIENISDLQTVPISDIVKNDFDRLDFTNASLGYWQRNILLAVPASNVFYMYDLERKIWQAPIMLSGATIGLFSVDENGNLIGHDAFKDESYLLFTGTNDNGQPIESTAIFAYNNYGERFALKEFTRYVQDGYISANGTLTRIIDYDYRGGKGTISREFSGGSTKYVYNITDSGGLGKAPLGERTLGGSSLLPSEDERRFRFAHSMPAQQFYEMRVTYTMNTLDGTWRLVAHGSDVRLTNTEINDITVIDV